MIGTERGPGGLAGSAPPTRSGLVALVMLSGLKQGRAAKEPKQTVRQEDNGPVLCEWSRQPIQIQDVVQQRWSSAGCVCLRGQLTRVPLTDLEGRLDREKVR